MELQEGKWYECTREITVGGDPIFIPGSRYLAVDRVSLRNEHNTCSAVSISTGFSDFFKTEPYDGPLAKYDKPKSVKTSAEDQDFLDSVAKEIFVNATSQLPDQPGDHKQAANMAYNAAEALLAERNKRRR